MECLEWFKERLFAGLFDHLATFQLYKFFYTQKALLAMGVISRNAIRDKAIDFSYHCFISRVGFVTKKPQPLPKIAAVWWPFTEELWISLAMSVVLFSLGFWCFTRLNTTGFGPDFTLVKSFTQVLKILLMKGISNSFQSASFII